MPFPSKARFRKEDVPEAGRTDGLGSIQRIMTGSEGLCQAGGSLPEGDYDTVPGYYSMLAWALYVYAASHRSAIVRNLSSLR